jgi:hypothetical protein
MYKLLILTIISLLTFQSFVEAKDKPLRNYHHIPSHSEQEDLAHIVRTLATSSWGKLLTMRSSLKKFGDRIDHLHPLRFWQFLFSSEEMKGYIHAMRDRKKIWKEFTSDCCDTLNEESERNNFRAEYIADFSNSLGVNASDIGNAIEQKKWNTFFDLLISQIPRQGDVNRYDQ